MSKIFIISNTNFNISKNLSTKEWLKNMDYYYYNVFIPYLIENKRDNDILIHLGNFLYKTKSIDLSVINFIQKLFEKISDILPIYMIEGENDSLGLNILKNFKNIEIIRKPTEIEILLDQKFALLPNNTSVDDLYNFNSDYCFFNFDFINSPKKDIIITRLKRFKKCYNGYYDKNGVIENIKNIGSPYNIESDQKKGFIVLETHTNKDKFIQNTKSPSFKKITINTEEDFNISKETLQNNYISLTINKKILFNNKLKTEMFITENNISNIIYSDDEILKDKNDIIDLDENSLSLNDMIIDHINKSDSENKERILLEFKNLIELNKK